MSKLIVSKFATDYFFRKETFGQTVGVYYPGDRTLRVCTDCPEMGLFAPVDLPYIYYGEELIVVRGSDEGFAAAVDSNPCTTCAWATGEVCLPCAVNPYSFGTLCSDYEVK